MMKEQGIVEKIWQNKALVRAQRTSSCEGCHHRGACGVLSQEKMLVEVVNEAQAKPGDRVEISLPEKSLLKISFLVYFLPIAALIIGALAGNASAEAFGLSSTMGAIVAGGLGMGISFYALIRMDRAAWRKTAYSPRLTRILSSGADPSPADNR